MNRLIFVCEREIILFEIGYVTLGVPWFCVHRVNWCRPNRFRKWANGQTKAWQKERMKRNREWIGKFSPFRFGHVLESYLHVSRACVCVCFLLLRKMKQMTPNCTHQSSQNETIIAHSELFILLLFLSLAWSMFCWLFVAATIPSMTDFHRTLIYCIYCQQQSFIRALYLNSPNQLLVYGFFAVSFILHARCHRTQNFSNWINQAIVWHWFAIVLWMDATVVSRHDLHAPSIAHWFNWFNLQFERRREKCAHILFLIPHKRLMLEIILLILFSIRCSAKCEFSGASERMSVNTDDTADDANIILLSKKKKTNPTN